MQPPVQPHNAVILIGASIRAAAQSAKRAGLNVIGVDLFGDQDCRTACDRFALLDGSGDAARLLDEFADAELVCVGGFADPGSLSRTLGRHACRLEKPIAMQDRLKQPKLLREIASAGGVSFPDTFSPNDPNIDETLPLTDGRWIIKPRSGSGGIGVSWLDTAIANVSSDVVIQRYISGRRYGVTMLIDRDRVTLLGVCRSLIHRHGGEDPMPFLYAGSFGPVSIDQNLTGLVTDIGSAIAQRTGVIGLCNIDLIVDRSGKPWLLEINPRWSGSSEVIEQSMIGDVVSLLAIGRDPRRASMSVMDPKRQTYKRVIYAPREAEPLRFQLQAIAPELNDQVQVADIPADGTVIEPGWPICSVLVRVDADKNRGDLFRVLGVVRSIRKRLLGSVLAPDHSSFSAANDLIR